jgi:hypothetical protein
MLRRATEALLDTTGVDAPTLRRMDDAGLLVALREADASAAYARRLDDRDLYKRAVWAEMDAVPEDLLAVEHDRLSDLERDIAASAGVDPEEVVVDVPAKPEMAETSARVLVGGEVRRLGEQSTLVAALRNAQRDQWRFGVYAPAAVSDRVGDAAIRTLGLDIDGDLVRDVRPGINATLGDFE